MRMIRWLLEVALHRNFNRLQFFIKGVDCQTSLNNIKGVVLVAGKGRITIGEGTRINSGPRHNPIGGDTRAVLVCRGGRIHVGKNCGLSNCAIVSDTEVTIDNGVMVGGGVKIYDTDFHNVEASRRSLERVGVYHGRSTRVLIKSNAFIGAHSLILKGVVVGENSVVGAGSVVTASIPDNEVWAGNPARKIRKLS